MRPFQSHIPHRVLMDLRRRLAETRWPDLLPGTTWEYGADVGTVSLLAHYWQNEYDWRTAEVRIHERSPRADAIPLMLVHGWPGSIVEFLALVEPLVRPTNASAPAFHVIIPSLPGFGFSGPRRMANALIVLMDRLGYARYGIQGGDWGSVIAQQMAHEAPAQVMGIHVSSFSKLHADELQTAAYALTDSPVGWLAWLTVTFQHLTDNDGDFLHAVDRDTFLTNVTLYWVTGTVGSSMRIHREHALSGGDSRLPRITRPVGQLPKGGHFAAFEQPDLLVEDVRRFFVQIGRPRTTRSIAARP